MWARRRRFLAPEHEVQELLKFMMRCGRPYVLERWTGLDAAGDTWEPLDNLTNCSAAIAAFEASSSRCAAAAAALPAAARRRRRRALTDPAGMLHGRCGAAQRPGRRAGRQDGALLVARRRLRRPPRGTVACLCPRGSFSDVVAYTRQTSALRSTVDTLLDAASFGCRWVLHWPAPGGYGPGRTPNPPVRCSSQLPPGHGPRATQRCARASVRPDRVTWMRR